MKHCNFEHFIRKNQFGKRFGTSLYSTLTQSRDHIITWSQWTAQSKLR